MALVNTQTPNLIQGISQQPPTLKREGQTELCNNLYPSPIDGLITRHPTEHVGKIMPTDELSPIAPMFHAIDRGGTEEYLVAFTHAGPQVWDTNGNQLLVKIAAGTPAYDNNDPRAEYAYAMLRRANLLASPEALSLSAGWSAFNSGAVAAGSEFTAWNVSYRAPATKIGGVYNLIRNPGPSVAAAGISQAPVNSEDATATFGSKTAVFSLWVKEAGTNPATSFTLRISDTTNARDYDATFGWSGGVPSLSSSHASIRDAGVWETLGDEYRVYVVFNVEDDGTTDAGDSRFFRILVNDFGASNFDQPAWGALLEEGVETPSSYLLDPYETIKAVTIADTTIFVNTTVDTAMDPASAASTKTPIYEGFVFMRTNASSGGIYGIEVELGTHGEEKSYVRQCRSGSDSVGVCIVTSSQELGVDTIETANGNYIVAQCTGTAGQSFVTQGTNPDLVRAFGLPTGAVTASADQVTSAFHSIFAAKAARPGPSPAPTTDLTTEVVGPVIRFEVDDTSDTLERIDVEGPGDNQIVAVFDEVEKITHLPVTCRDGYKVKVLGDPDEEGDDYWVEFQGDESGASLVSGRWVETVAHDVLTEFDAATMPHQLVRKQDDAAGTATGTAFALYFELGPIEWFPRVAGDDTTNPAPTFIGFPINDVFFHQGRLGFLSDQNVILSESNVFFNFFRTTVLELLDSDPVDIQASHSKVNILKHAIPSDANLLIQSAKSWFLVQGRPTITPETATIDPKVELDSQDLARPASIGRSVLFGFSRGQFSGVRELREVGEETFDTNDVSLAVPKLIQGEILEFSTATHEGIAVMRGKDDLTTLYMLKILDNGSERAQLAWFTYTFSTMDILTAQFFQDVLYLVISRDDGAFLERMKIGNSLVDEGLEFQVRLDRRITEAETT